MRPRNEILLIHRIVRDDEVNLPAFCQMHCLTGADRISVHFDAGVLLKFRAQHVEKTRARQAGRRGNFEPLAFRRLGAEDDQGDRRELDSVPKYSGYHLRMKISELATKAGMGIETVREKGSLMDCSIPCSD